MIHSSIVSQRIEAVTRIRTILSVRLSQSLPHIEATGEVDAAGFVPPLVEMCRDCNDQMKFEAGWALVNLLSGTTGHVLRSETRRRAHLRGEAGFVDDDIRDQAVLALSNVAGESSEHRDLVLQAGAMNNILWIVGQERQRLSTPRSATWALGNHWGGSPQPSQGMISPAAEFSGATFETSSTGL